MIMVFLVILLCLLSLNKWSRRCDCAHLGVALLNVIPPQSEKSSSEALSKSETAKSGKLKKPKPTKAACKALSINGDSSSKSRASARLDSTSQSAGSRHLTAAEMQRQKLKKLVDELNEEGDGHAAPIVKLGDASMASPFTAKHASVAPTTGIIRQGSSTLVITLQTFEILGLNCLATAYVLSVTLMVSNWAMFRPQSVGVLLLHSFYSSLMHVPFPHASQYLLLICLLLSPWIVCTPPTFIDFFGERD